MAKRIQAPEAPAAEAVTDLVATQAPAAEVETLAIPKRKFVVTFNPPTPVGPKAARMEVEADNEGEALAIWKQETGFTGTVAVPPVVTEVFPETEPEAAPEG